MWLDGGVETYVDGLMKMIVFEFDEPSFDELGGGGSPADYSGNHEIEYSISSSNRSRTTYTTLLQVG